MRIIPAIDIIGGMPVRLYQGDYAKQEVVADSVLDLAKRYVQAGASFVHLVDLDGAKAGRRVNDALIVETAKALKIPVEVGGGIRTLEDVAYYLENGVERVILGTAALEDSALLQAALTRYGKRIAVGIDCKDGYVCTHGWLETSELHYIAFAKRLAQMGVKSIIVTDISKDGTLAGPNVEMLGTLKEQVAIDIIASGGVRDLHHIEVLKQLDIAGVIVGKAIVRQTLDLAAAIALCKEG